MDLISALKSEFLRPLVTLAIPGATAIGPYILITGYYIPNVSKFWDDHSSAFIAILIVCVLSAGLILEDVGAQIENLFWERIKKIDTKYKADWYKYLQLQKIDELTGERYLQTILIRLKFELSMAPALVFLWLGLIWIHNIYEIWPLHNFILLSLFVIGLTAYLFYEAYKSGCLLAQTRRLIIEAVEEQTQGGSTMKHERMLEVAHYLRDQSTTYVQEGEIANGYISPIENEQSLGAVVMIWDKQDKLLFFTQIPPMQYDQKILENVTRQMIKAIDTNDAKVLEKNIVALTRSIEKLLSFQVAKNN